MDFCEFLEAIGYKRRYNKDNSTVFTILLRRYVRLIVESHAYMHNLARTLRAVCLGETRSQW
jgi:hypothetical protein